MVGLCCGSPGRSPRKKTGSNVARSARWLGLALVALAACHKSPEPSSAPAAPRIVTLSPSATEIVAALGATPWLVGVDNYSVFPPDVTALPKVGSYIAPNLETIVRLRPSLVIIDDVHSAQAAVLHDRGIATVECAIHGLADVKTALNTVGARIGKSAQAAAAIVSIDSALDKYAAAKPAKHVRILAVIDREADGLGAIVAAGPGSWVDELLAIIGADNALSAAGTRYPKISTEEVLRAKPDVVLDLSRAARDGLAPWNAINIPAVATRRVFAVTDAYVIAPSPRVALALERLAAAIVQTPTK